MEQSKLRTTAPETQKTLAGLRLTEQLPRNALSAFLCCFAAGYLAHLFAFTNIIPNADGLSRVYDTQQMTIAGRWFLHYASIFNGFLQAPAVIGFFTVLFLSLSAGLTVSLLQIRSRVLSGMTGVIMAVFPPVAFTLLFLFTSSAYSFGILLAVFSVWLTDRTRRFPILGVVLLACAVGTYQAYFAVAAALAVIRVLLYALEADRTARQTLRFALRFLVRLLAGLLLYYLELLLFLRVKNLSLMDYRGISGIGESGLILDSLSRLGAAYTDLIPSYSTALIHGANIAFILLGILSFVRISRRNGLFRKPALLALVILGIALLPPALNFAVLLVRTVSDHMRYALVFGYVLALALADRASRRPVLAAPEGAGQKAEEAAEDSGQSAEAVERHGQAAEAVEKPGQSAESLERPGQTAQLLEAPPREAEAVGRRASALPLFAAVCLSLFFALLSFQVDNLAYTASATAHRATESFTARLVSRVESTPGYHTGMEVVVIGSFPDEAYPPGVEVFSAVDAPAYSVLPLNKHIYYYLNDWLNVPWPEPSEETFLRISESETFRNMPLYPNDGSVVIENGHVIVKLSDYYRPKKEYEIQYENRK